MKNCNQCGKCCIKYSDGGLSATADEIALWEIFRPDIAEYVRDGEIWVDPESGKPLSTCPFLTPILAESTNISAVKYSCSIYHDRPDDCRAYPSNVAEIIRDECEMIETSDLENISRAKLALDNLLGTSTR